MSFEEDKIIKDLRNLYKEVKIKIGKVEDIENFLSNYPLPSASELEVIKDQLRGEQSLHMDEIFKFNDYQDIIDLLNRSIFASVLEDILNADIPTEKIVGQFPSEQISGIYTSQVQGLSPVVYASDIEGIISANQIDSVEASIIENFDPTISASEIIGQLQGNNINQIYVSKVNDLIKSSKVEYVYTSQVDNLFPIQASDINGSFNSQETQAIFDSMFNQHNLKLTLGGDFNNYQSITGEPGIIFACHSPTLPNCKEIKGSKVPSEMIQGLIYCSLWAAAEYTTLYDSDGITYLSRNYYYALPRSPSSGSTDPNSSGSTTTMGDIYTVSLPANPNVAAPLELRGMLLNGCFAVLAGIDPCDTIFNYQCA